MGTIRVEGLGKYYKRYPSRWSRLLEWMDPNARVRHEKHWVLREVSFAIRAGESIGIIGHNGAGKSTLLKLITGTTRPSAGHVEVGGRVAALLELGMGFHPEFTGRQNCYMSGQLLGYSNEEVAARMGEIEAFAEIGDYIDQPVRTYSSGMQVRLAFSVATCMRPDILIVDEALAVGDVFFQQKCFERIREFRDRGTTLLFVTHSLSSVYGLCNRAILLDQGALVCDADPKTVIDLYQNKELEGINRAANRATLAVARDVTSATASESQIEGRMPFANVSQSAEGEVNIETDSPVPQDFETGLAEIELVEILSGGSPVAAVVSDSEVAITVTARAKVDLGDPHIGFQIRNSRGEPIFMTHTHAMGKCIGPVSRGQCVIVAFSMKLSVAAGEYTITAGVANEALGDGNLREMLVRRQAAASLTVVRNRLAIGWSGVCNLDPTLQVTHPGAIAPPISHST